MIAHSLRNRDSAWLGKPFQTRRDINAVSIDVVTFNHHITQTNADPEFNALVPRHRRITITHRALDLSRAGKRSLRWEIPLACRRPSS